MEIEIEDSNSLNQQPSQASQLSTATNQMTDGAAQQPARGESPFPSTSILGVTPPLNSESLAAVVREGLRLLFQDQTVVEKSREQLEYIMACIECQNDLQVVLPTGGGKSAGWLVPAMLDPQRVSAIVTPYTLVLEDQLQSAKEKGIVAERFTATNSHQLRLRKDIQLIFVQPETMASLPFKE